MVKTLYFCMKCEKSIDKNDDVCYNGVISLIWMNKLRGGLSMDRSLLLSYLWISLLVRVVLPIE